MMIEGESFLVLGEDWGYYPSTTEHLLKRLVPRNKFLWVDAIGCRAPELNLYTIKRAFGKCLRWISPGGQYTRDDSVTVYSPPSFPLHPTRAVRWWNRSMMSRGIRRRLHEMDI